MSDEIIEPAGERASSHTSGRIKIVGRVSGQRCGTIQQNLAILRDAFAPEGSVHAEIERHKVGSCVIYIWCRQAIPGALSALAAASVGRPGCRTGSDVAGATCRPGCVGRIRIKLAYGVGLTVDDSVDADALSRVIGVLPR